VETQYLKTLCAVIETGSFSKAADDLNITQSAVSQRIKNLEARYGTPLIGRQGARLVLNSAGTVIYNKAKQILMLEKELENELKNLGNKARLSICCTPTFGVVYLPKVLNLFFMINSADVDFKFALNPPALSLQGVLKNDYDLAIIEHFNEIKVPGGITVQLPYDELIFIAAPSLNLSGSEVALTELMQQCLIARRSGCSSRSLLQDNLAKAGKSIDDFKGSIIYDDLNLTIQTVLAGRGVAFVSRNLVSEYLKRGELTEHKVHGFSCFRLRSAVMLKNRCDEPLVKSFIDCVIRAFDAVSLTD
jgi:DNA-binding transcriptional LysR family regulator